MTQKPPSPPPKVNIRFKLPAPGSGSRAVQGPVDLDVPRIAALLEAARYPEVESLARSAIARNPQSGQAWKALVAAQLAQGLPASQAARTAMRLLPTDVEVLSNLGLALHSEGKPEEALNFHLGALKLRPDFLPAMINLAKCLSDMGKFDLAASTFDRARGLAPDSYPVLRGLSTALLELGLLQEAQAHQQRLVELHPDDGAARANLGAILVKQGRVQEGIQAYRHALRLDTDLFEVIPNLVFAEHYLPEHSPQALHGMSREYGQALVRQVAARRQWQVDGLPGRRLRVGLVSTDFRQHPVAYFLENVLRSLKNRHGDSLELLAYHCDGREDAMTQRLKPFFGQWRQCAALPDSALADLVYDDRVDILIDLIGYTARPRLGAFAARPAPVQVSWLGYFATTGLDRMDYVLADPLCLPPEGDQLYTEQVWRLPRTRLCLTPPGEEIAVGPLPARANGHVTFGCFNNLSKVNDLVLAAWSRILASLPDSRLLIKTQELAVEASAQAFQQRLEQAGISVHRVRFERGSDRWAYLDSYNGIDIALDPFPYPGGTTTAESLWMGVPVLTLAGQTMLSRQGLGLLVNAGLPDWVAHSTDEYVNKAVAFASDLDALARLRQGLRAQVLASPVFDADRFADDMNGALRGMWQRWCGSQQASATAMP